MLYRSSESKSDVNGIPAGGAVQQVLQKLSNADYDVGWATITSGGSSIAGNIVLGSLSPNSELYETNLSPGVYSFDRWCYSKGSYSTYARYNIGMSDKYTGKLFLVFPFFRTQNSTSYGSYGKFAMFVLRNTNVASRSYAIETIMNNGVELTLCIDNDYYLMVRNDQSKTVHYRFFVLG